MYHSFSGPPIIDTETYNLSAMTVNDKNINMKVRHVVYGYTFKFKTDFKTSPCIQHNKNNCKHSISDGTHSQGALRKKYQCCPLLPRARQDSCQYDFDAFVMMYPKIEPTILCIQIEQHFTSKLLRKFSSIYISNVSYAVNQSWISE